jgi:hypothetical protein
MTAPLTLAQVFTSAGLMPLQTGLPPAAVKNTIERSEPSTTQEARFVQGTQQIKSHSLTDKDIQALHKRAAMFQSAAKEIKPSTDVVVRGIVPNACAQRNDGAHVSSLKVPGTNLPMNVIVTEEERQDVIEALEEQGAEFTKYGLSIRPLINAIRGASISVDDIYDVLTVDYRELSLQDLLQFASFGIVLLHTSLYENHFVGVKSSLDHLYMEMMVRNEKLHRAMQADADYKVTGYELILPQFLIVLINLMSQVAIRDAGLEEILFFTDTHSNNDSILSIPDAFRENESEVSKAHLNDYHRGILFKGNWPLASVLAYLSYQLELPSGDLVDVEQIPVGVYYRDPQGKTRWADSDVIVSPHAAKLLGKNITDIKSQLYDCFYDPKTHGLGIISVAGTPFTVTMALPKHVLYKKSTWVKKAVSLARALNANLKHKIDPRAVSFLREPNDNTVMFQKWDGQDLSRIKPQQYTSIYDAAMLLVLVLSEMNMDRFVLSNLDFGFMASVLEDKVAHDNTLTIMEREKMEERIPLYRAVHEAMTASDIFQAFETQEEA